MIQFIPLLIALPLIAFWLWMLVDMTNNVYLTKETKEGWFVKFYLLNVVGAFWYYLVEYRPSHK